MRFLSIPLFLLFFSCASALGDSAVCDIAKSAISDASDIRKLQIRKRVPCYVHNQEQVKQYLKHAISTKIPAKKLESEDFVYKALGFLPENFDYKSGIIDLYLSQLGGYYDPEKDHFVMAGWMPASMQTTVAVHELTHALQDQYYDLDKFIDMKIENSDALLARSALVEGDATAVMFDYTRRLSGLPPLSKDKDVEGILMQNLLGASLMVGTKGVPQSLQMTLLFPYTSGLRFTHQLLRIGGYPLIDRAFAHPPRSTEEVLHPEKYHVGNEDFIIPSDEEVLEGSGVTPAAIEYRDVIGEFSISALLTMVAPGQVALADIAAGWGGDKVVLISGEQGKRNLIWLVRWDTEPDAKEFFQSYGEALSKRFTSSPFIKSNVVWESASNGKRVKFTQIGLATKLQIN